MTTTFALIEAQIATLKFQLSIADELLRAAAAQDDLGAAKFGLGMLTGAVVAASPEDDRYALNSSAMDAARAPVIGAVLDTFVWMSRRGYELIEELEGELRRLRFHSELN